MITAGIVYISSIAYKNIYVNTINIDIYSTLYKIQKVFHMAKLFLK